ncbi:MAG: HAD family hydrolase [Ignavibacterium sp.]|uniref:HAD family hydrolase n=1 Tax=Ignavibacterium sp. TaxID=2651167 RepID=UPI00404A657F
MTEIKHICFDLDGTLVHSAKTIYKTTTNTLDELGIYYSLPEEKFNQRIGQHFKDIFKYFGIVVPDFEHFISVYKSNYFDFIDDSELYEGTRETLEKLKSLEMKITLLTTKAQDQAEKIISHFNLENYFDIIMGRRDGIPHKPSPEPLIIICNELNISTAETLMVGDTELDILCGKNAGAKTCAASYGYRSSDLLNSHNPDYIIDSISEVIYAIFNSKH